MAVIITFVKAFYLQLYFVIGAILRKSHTSEKVGKLFVQSTVSSTILQTNAKLLNLFVHPAVSR